MIFRRPAEVHDFAKTDDGASPKSAPVRPNRFNRAA
jgi:hypothetical protein